MFPFLKTLSYLVHCTNVLPLDSPRLVSLLAPDPQPSHCGGHCRRRFRMAGQCGQKQPLHSFSPVPQKAKLGGLLYSAPPQKISRYYL